MLLRRPTVDDETLERAAGWRREPQGLCRGDRCVPVPGVDLDEALPVELVSERLGMPLAHDEDHGLWALGPEADGRALRSAELPDIELVDLDGEAAALRRFVGRKLLLVAWASW